jgi:hypothetical protein
MASSGVVSYLASSAQGACEEFGRIDADGTRDFDEFQDLDASLSRLDLPNEGIGAFQFHCQFALREAGGFAGGHDGRNQGTMLCAAEILQMSAPKMEAAQLNENYACLRFGRRRRIQKVRPDWEQPTHT